MGADTATREIAEDTISAGFYDLGTRLFLPRPLPATLTPAYGNPSFFWQKLDTERAEEDVIMLRRNVLLICTSSPTFGFKSSGNRSSYIRTVTGYVLSGPHLFADHGSVNIALEACPKVVFEPKDMRAFHAGSQAALNLF